MLTQRSNVEALQQLVKDWGFDDELDMLEKATFDSCVPAMCMNADCFYSTEMEPDQDRGWCEECETNSVKSCLILAGII